MAQFAPQYSLLKIIDKIKACVDFIFWAVFILSIVPMILDKMKVEMNIDDLVNTTNIISISLFFILDMIVEYILIPLADAKRRDDFIDNSFGSSFSTNSSVGYFDNDGVTLGIYKAAVNLFENNYFTYSLVKAITVKKVILPAIVFLSILVVAYYGFKEVPFGLSLLQVFFSANLFGGLVKHCILMVKLETIYEAWVSLFQVQDFHSNVENYRGHIYRQWLLYESLHNRIPAGIPDKVFQKLNPKLTQDWLSIKVRYNII